MKKKEKLTIYVQKNKSKVIAISCIGLAFVFSYIIPSILNREAKENITFVAVSNIKSGTKISEEMIKQISVASNDLSKDVYIREKDIVGKYAVNNINQDDLINNKNIADSPIKEDDYFSSLDGNNRAVSVTLKSLAKGVSNKLQSGDIVSIIVPNEETEEVYIPEELRYIEVVSVTNESGVETAGASEEENMSATVTLLVREEQASILALLEDIREIHFSLVCRNNEGLKKELLEEQLNVLKEIYPENFEESTIVSENKEETTEVFENTKQEETEVIENE